jgi:hypothetical protein
MHLLFRLCHSLIQASAQGAGNADYKKATSIYDFTAVDIDGNQVSLDKYK